MKTPDATQSLALMRSELHAGMAKFSNSQCCLMDRERRFPWCGWLFRFYRSVHFMLHSRSLKWKARMIYKGPSSRIDEVSCGAVVRKSARATGKTASTDRETQSRSLRPG